MKRILFLDLGLAAKSRARRSKALGSAGAGFLTNSQLKARSRPNLNGQLAEALRAAGYPVIDYKAWLKLTAQMTQQEFERDSRERVRFIAEFPFAPARPTWDYRKTATQFEKAHWHFQQIPGLRRWRIDFAWAPGKLAIEIDGGGYVAGAHSRGAHTTLDNLKRCELAVDGWALLRLDGTMVRHQVAIEIIQRAVRARQAV